MKKYIDIENWNRKEHFYHYINFEDPYFGITVNIDITNLYTVAKAKKESVFMHYFYQIMLACNTVEVFKYRIEEDKVVCYDSIQASSTIGREDGTFGFISFPFEADFDKFKSKCEIEIAGVKNSSGLYVNSENRIDIIHFSPVPWLRFTEMKHPMYINKGGSVPRISTGKFFKEGDKILMPISISANHGLIDGYHVSKFIETIEQNILAIK